MEAKVLFEQVKRRVKRLYPEEEAREITFLVLESVIGLNKTDYLLNKEFAIDLDQSTELESVLMKLERHMPVQYVLKEAHFYGMEFLVTPETLIPRPETELICELVINNQQQINPQILDIGTGSGCIAITLAKYLTGAEVSAYDFIQGAIEVAKHNARRHEVKVNFLLQDVLSLESLAQSYDVIVSNPPYVLQSEKQEMRANVLKHEPETALFVGDHEPLLFYEKITILAETGLNPSGQLYFEINEAYGPEVVQLMEARGFSDVRLAQDMHGKDRIVWGTLR